MPIGAFRLNTISQLLEESAPAGRTAKTITGSGGIYISSLFYKFNGTSLYHDGVNDYIQSISTDFSNIGTGDFTLECWINKGATLFFPFVFDAGSGANINIRVRTAGLIDFRTSSTILLTSAASFPSASTWAHLAVVRSSGTVKIYINGVADTNTLTSNTTSFSGYTYFKTADVAAAGYGTGYLDEVRISKVARYTANFTPTTKQFISDDDTLLLFHANGVNASTTFTDDTSTTEVMNSLVFVTSAGSSGQNITIPSVNAGDLAILVDAAFNSAATAPTLAVPSGWTQIQNTSQSTLQGNRLVTSYKILSSGDMSTIINGMTGTIGVRKVMMIYRPNISIGSVVGGAVAQQATSSTPTNQNFTIGPFAITDASVNTTVSFATYASNGTIVTRGNSAAGSQSRELTQTASLYVKTFENFAGTTTISMPDYGSNALSSIYIRVT